jgi:flagellar basal body-associated protein FliL
MSDNETVTMDSMGNVPPPLDYQSPEPPKKSNKTVWIIVIVVVVLLCCCCVIIIGVAAANWNSIQNSMNGFTQLALPALRI